MKIAYVAKVFPDQRFEQERILSELMEMWCGVIPTPSKLQALHRNVKVGARHLALPIEEYRELKTFGDANRAWVREATNLGSRGSERALEGAGVSREQVGALIFVSVTGLSCPSIDARIMNRLGLPPGIKRLPIFGLGCVAGAAGIARAADYVRAYPDQAAVLVSVELCSLTLQRGDRSMANLIASGLFGDGAAAAVVTGESLPGDGPQIVESRSVFYPESENVMGWDISESGFKIILSSDVPEVVERHLRADVDGFLAEHGLSREDIRSWVCHPGGPKVLQAVHNTLGLTNGALDLTWQSLAEVGNLSSASVLMVMADTMAEKRPPAGSYGMLMAMGPGFCSELVLLQW